MTNHTYRTENLKAEETKEPISAALCWLQILMSLQINGYLIGHCLFVSGAFSPYIKDESGYCISCCSCFSSSYC
jgi:hypothetical protein